MLGNDRAVSLETGENVSVPSEKTSLGYLDEGGEMNVWHLFNSCHANTFERY